MCRRACRHPVRFVRGAVHLICAAGGLAAVFSVGLAAAVRARKCRQCWRASLLAPVLLMLLKLTADPEKGSIEYWSLGSPNDPRCGG